MTIVKNTEWPTSFETCEQVGQKIIAVEKATDGQTANLGNELLAAYQECLKEDADFHVEKFKQAMASVLGFPYKYKGEKYEGTRTQKSMLESSPYLKTYFHAMKTAESAFKGDNSGEKKAIAQSKAGNLSSLSDATTMQSVRHASEAVAKYRKAEKKKAAKKVVAITEAQIQVQAYLLAEAEGFSGNPEAYWLEAEAQLKAA